MKLYLMLHNPSSTFQDALCSAKILVYKTQPSIYRNLNSQAAKSLVYWCSLVEAKGPLISMETCLVVFVSNHLFYFQGSGFCQKLS